MNNVSPSWVRWVSILTMVLWLCSFFLPAITFPPDTPRHWSVATGMQRGYEAAAILAVGMVLKTIVLFDGLSGGHLHWRELTALFLSALWLANFWMIAAPFRIKSLLRGGSRLFLIVLWLWAFSPLALAWKDLEPRPTYEREYTLQIGFFLWWFSLLSMASICTIVRSRSGVQSDLLPYPPPAGKSN